MTREDIDRIASEYFNDKESEHEMDAVFDLAKKALEDMEILEKQMREPKTGHWIVKEGRGQGYDIAGIKTWYIQIMCDKCGFIKTAIEGHTGQYRYCPNCGAKMQEVEK
jgi:hypothetical protein